MCHPATDYAHLFEEDGSRCDWRDVRSGGRRCLRSDAHRCTLGRHDDGRSQDRWARWYGTGPVRQARHRPPWKRPRSCFPDAAPPSSLAGVGDMRRAGPLLRRLMPWLLVGGWVLIGIIGSAR